MASDGQRERQKSRYLSRLHLLKELFTVFVNRLVSDNTGSISCPYSIDPPVSVEFI
jgi:hypothetical protein